MANDITAKATSASIVGYWVGAIGAFLGFCGIALTLYIFFEKQPSIFWLTFSGWMAMGATLVAVVIFGGKLVDLARDLEQQKSLLERDLSEAKQQLSKVINISEYISSKAIRTAVPRAKPIGTDIPADNVPMPRKDTE